MKRHLTLLIFLFAAVAATYAVTDKEMEEARTITAQLYLRYANDGSGYLDEMHPTTMAALEKGLKAKEKENLKSFKAAAKPGDYKNWDKTKLVEYWSDTFFRSPGLIEKGKVARSRVRKRVSAMKVAAPAADATAPAPIEQTPASAQTPSQPTAQAPQPTAGEPAAETQMPAAIDDSAAAKAITEAQAQLEAADSLLDDTQTSERKNSYTWVYILILCILVAVVVGLVIFASNVLKNQNKADADSEPEPAPRRQAPTIESSRLVAPPNAEWRERLREAEAERDAISSDLAQAKNEIKRLNSHIADLERQLATAQATAAVAVEQMHTAATPQALPSQPEEIKHRETVIAEPAPQPQTAAETKTATRPAVIYLGRVNNKGIFVRADRNLRPDASVYRLETTDGFAGTFRVANNTEVWDRALANPEMVLAGGCVGSNLNATDGMTQVITESSGTAIFEGGCWKVIRKAKVRYQ